jgi:hypothetical protein
MVKGITQFVIRIGGIMNFKKNNVLLGIFICLLVLLACDFLGGNEKPVEVTQAPVSENLQATTQVLITQMAQTSQARIQAMPPTAVPPTAVPPTAVPPTLTPEPAATQTTEAVPNANSSEPAELIEDLSINRSAFYCVESDGPTTVTFTVEMSDIERGMAIFWRLYEKSDQSQTEWKNVSMVRKSGTARTFTFDANSWDGTNNFFYPPGFAESWFQFQLISGDGKYRTPVYRDDITFFPCAQ